MNRRPVASIRRSIGTTGEAKCSQPRALRRLRGGAVPQDREECPRQHSIDGSRPVKAR
jgi:hypothetical protein